MPSEIIQPSRQPLKEGQWKLNKMSDEDAARSILMQAEAAQEVVAQSKRGKFAFNDLFRKEYGLAEINRLVTIGDS